jgi:hypothetical protein
VLCSVWVTVRDFWRAGEVADPGRWRPRPPVPPPAPSLPPLPPAAQDSTITELRRQVAELQQQLAADGGVPVAAVRASAVYRDAAAAAAAAAADAAAARAEAADLRARPPIAPAVAATLSVFHAMTAMHVTPRDDATDGPLGVFDFETADPESGDGACEGVLSLYRQPGVWGSQGGSTADAGGCSTGCPAGGRRRRGPR